MSELATDNARFEMPNTVYRDNDELYIKGVKKML